MPLMPPGNRVFNAYRDGNGKLQAVYVGPAPIVCAICGRTTYQTASRKCPWASLCRRPDQAVAA